MRGNFLVKALIVVFLGFILTVVSTNYSTSHLYAFGNECNEESRLLGTVWCYDVTEIHGFPMGFSPEIPGSIGSGYEDLNRTFYLERFLFDVSFFSMIVYLISNLFIRCKKQKEPDRKAK